MSGSYWQGALSGSGMTVSTHVLGTVVSGVVCAPSFYTGSIAISFQSPFETLERRVSDLEKELHMLKGAILGAISDRDP